MRPRTKNLLDRICPDVLRNACRDQLEQAVTIIDEEIKINESCQIRTDENEDELKMLYHFKCKCRQRISIMKEE